MRNERERGSAILLAIFVLVLLAAMGASLLVVTNTEMKSSQVGLRAKKAFFGAESALEDGRETLRVVNKSSASAADRETLDDELATAAGVDGAINFDVALLKATYDSSGNPTGFTGYGDDAPLRPMASFGEQRYAAFLQNDPLDAMTPLHDSNDRVLITGAAAGPRNSLEVVQALVERISFPNLPATITILGPSADFDGGDSAAKTYTGNDCDLAGVHVPVVGVLGGASETNAETGVRKPGSYSEGGQTGNDTVDDVDTSIDPNWKNCQYLLELARGVRAAADVVGNSSTPEGDLGTSASPRVVYIEGDYDISGGIDGGGLLWVTGTLTFAGQANWTGVIFTVGQGHFERNGAGNGVISGANLVANVAGADGVMWTADDCNGPDGVGGTSDDGTSVGTYHNNGSGTGDTGYCLSAIHNAQEEFPFKIVDFRQR